MDTPKRSRVVAVHLQALPVECAFSDAGAPSGDETPLAERLAAVSSDIRGRAVLIDVTAAARMAGVFPGMTASEARARVPELQIRARDLERELRRLRSAAELLFALGPLVEVAPPGHIFVEIARSKRVLEKLLGGEVNDPKIGEYVVRVLGEAGHDVTVAVAKDPDTARTLAAWRAHERRLSASPPVEKKDKKKKVAPRKVVQSVTPLSPVVVVSGGCEMQMLKSLPLEALTWMDALDDPDGTRRERMRAVHTSMRVLGIYSVSAFRALPVDGVTTRFGEAGALMMRRARAEGERPLRAFSPPDRIVEEYEVEGVLEDLEPVLFVLKRLFSRIEARLEARTLAASSLSLMIEIEPNLDRAVDVDALRRSSSREQVEMEIVLARPSRRAITMLNIAREKLGGALPGAVTAITVEARGASIDRGAQLDLFTSHAKKLEDVSDLVGRLIAAFGADAVFSPATADTHRPEKAWTRRPFEIERALSESSEARVLKPRAPQVIQVLSRELPRSDFALPQIDGELCVATPPDGVKRSVEAVLEELETKKRSWPSPIQRSASDEPLPVLPPRPFELLEIPERATLNLKVTEKDEDCGILSWRGTRHRLRNLGAVERLEAEWWTNTPLTREYVVAELSDGRRLWIFFDPQGDVFVHGVFD